MENYQNRGQGTFTSIMWMVVILMIVDIAIAVLMYFNVQLQPASSATDNTAVTPQVTVGATDNSVTTDNTLGD
jgi:hypothetical protein